MKFLNSSLIFFAAGFLALAQVTAAERGQGFSNPEEAVSALAAAAASRDGAKLAAIFGPSTDDLRNPDPVAGENELETFAAAFNNAHRVVMETPTRATLEIGVLHWPFPIPLTQEAGRWFFDADAGRDELLSRRIGRNELAVLLVLRAGVDAQREYAFQDRDEDEVLEYAQHIVSAPGRKDGLYWSPLLDGSLSPLGPLVAVAHGEGYQSSVGVKNEPQPFHGYFFKILTEQGEHAPGGKYDYVINGNMIGGFAFVAWPAEYGNSGIMTFIINHQGKVYQKDLGPETASKSKAIKSYDPDPTWSLSRD